MNLDKANYRKILTVTFIIASLIIFSTYQQSSVQRIDFGLADSIPHLEQTAGRTRRRRRVRRIIIWRYIITLISRNRDAGVLYPRVFVKNLSENRAIQKHLLQKAKHQRQQFRTRIREFESTLAACTKDMEQIIEQYQGKLNEIKSRLTLWVKIIIRWRRSKLAIVYHYQRLADMQKPLQISLVILVISIIMFSLSIVMNNGTYSALSSPFCACAVALGTSIIKKNHNEYKSINEKLKKSGYQAVLDYGWLVECNPSVLYPTVLDNFDWSQFNELAKKYFRSYSDFLLKERVKTKVKKQQIADHEGIQIDFLSQFSPLESADDSKILSCPFEISDEELTEILNQNSKKHGGRKFEHNFMPLFKAFIILRFMDIKPSVVNIIRTLCGNPYLLVKLQFKDNQLPSERVIYRFDQVMSRYGLWNECFELKVFNNIEQGVINPQKEKYCGQDTFHEQACATKGKKKKKCAYCSYLSASDVPQPTDNTAGILVKKKTEHHYAHKVALANLLNSELCLSFKVFKGNTNDAKTYSPLLEKVKKKFPEFNFTHILVDGIYDEAECYEETKKYYPHSKMVASRINPRNRKDKAISNRGILLVNKRGQAVCIRRQKMIFITRDLKKRDYIWGCPFYHGDATSDKQFTTEQKYQIIEQYKYSRDLTGTAKRHGITPKTLKAWISRMQCAKDKKLDPSGLRGLEDECSYKNECCPDAKNGRIFRTKATDYPFIDWDLPQFSYQRRTLTALRLANERIISRLKENLSGDKLFKQNDFNVEAHIAKSFLAQHVFASVAFKLERPGAIRQIKTFYSMFQ